ncbi:MAG TPA: hypothetical protein VEI97_18495, partial [bacterium]|nr:hypothetical protein [bacterium]
MAALLAPPLMACGIDPRAALIPIILLAGLVPVLAYLFARRLGVEVTWALMAALLALTHPRLMMYAVTTYAMIPYTVFGAASLLALVHGAATGRRTLELGVVLAGVSHLLRGDGISLVLSALLTTLIATRSFPRTFKAALLYLLVMSPVLVRNQTVFGRPMPPGNTLSPVIREYNDLFSTTREINLSSYLSLGAEKLIEHRTNAIGWEIWHVANLYSPILLVLVVPLLGSGHHRRLLWPLAVMIGVTFCIHLSIPLIVVGQSGTEVTPSIYVGVPLLPALEMAGLSLLLARHGRRVRRLALILVGLVAISSTVQGIVRCRGYQLAVLEFGRTVECCVQRLGPLDRVVLMSNCPADFNAIAGIRGVG